ncbi:MAG: PEGA domain-containing protein [Deltaproteobacteria bacterium]|nr:MAG: PEGA domain-containing protein [Deltaproteobacteria bacterium]
MAQPGGAPELFEPDVFGKYFLLQRMAVGGMAEVIRAKTVGAGGFQKELVIKRILPRLAANPDFVRMLVNEAKITVGLNHPNIAQIYELGQIDGRWFMAMELVDGVQLRDLVGLLRGRASSLGVDEAVWIVYEALKGLDYAHRVTDPMGVPLGIVHCDISPDNIMVTYDGSVKVVDFGIARAGAGLSNYRQGLVMGKLNYLSPEQATGSEVDPRTDVYAAGVVLYYLLTGAYPYGRFERLEELAPLVAGRIPYISAREHDAAIPAELDEILERAVHPQREARYPDARAFMTALEDFLYPTPHSPLQQHIRRELERSFTAERDRMARLRANDDVVMKVLAGRVDGRYQGNERPDTAQVHALPPRRPVTREPSGQIEARPGRPRRVRSGWAPSLAQVAIVLLLSVGLAAVWHLLGARLFAPAGGLLVVDSEPRGARATVDGSPVPGVTPLLLEGMDLGRAHQVALSLEDYEPWRGTTAGEGAPYEVLRARLRRAYGTLHVESIPAGAKVLLDGEARGRTPARLEKVDLRVPHKLTLKKRGFELDEVMIENLEDGATVQRRLLRR